MATATAATSPAPVVPPSTASAISQDGIINASFSVTGHLYSRLHRFKENHSIAGTAAIVVAAVPLALLGVIESIVRTILSYPAQQYLSYETPFSGKSKQEINDSALSRFVFNTEKGGSFSWKFGCFGFTKLNTAHFEQPTRTA